MIVCHYDLEVLFSNYKNLLQERLDRYRLLHICEDSVRYDFFSALIETYGLRPSQIQIEVPINEKCFNSRNNDKAFRKEKPLIDLVVKEEFLNISAEFGLFRQNSNEDGTINQTYRTVKMLNDMIRVSLEANFTGTRGFFICVADHKMLGHQMNSKIIDSFPSNYYITTALIEHQLKQKTNNFDHRFLQIFKNEGRNIVSKLIFDESLKAKLVMHETKLLIWEVYLE
ncbi:hypothetical protein [Sphingobacterium psychroaquaticum]|uniref:Uncharacterized protein n=1 Tax=Sphingobacterium psychroaquaticum TaxID=561061 RepID=A0A1X7LDT2_9SPHI|nr:hypothetical protein [Sphingobacterium psychroaquaticum]SMG51654.1 hypothetical protein SAMN05660862_0011 [Sphingobacterium psychroaquaticum]